MKKLFCGLLALTSLSAFAQRHMVTLSGYETGDNADRSLDFSSYTGNDTNANTGKHAEATNLALNYAFAITDSFQLGLRYQNNSQKLSGDKVGGRDGGFTSYGLQIIYNFAHQVADTSYLALHYDMKQYAESDSGAGNDDDKDDIATLEFGHRWSLGTIGGMNFNYSPSANLAFSKTTPGASGVDDRSSTVFTLNFVKFDVLF